MRVLLDTQSYIWFVKGDERLSTSARNTLGESAVEKFISLSSVWEIAIKISIGKLKLSQDLSNFIIKHQILNEIKILEINLSHFDKYIILPFHHRYPFDRLIISQSLVEVIPVISSDNIFDRYGVNRIW